jgi:ribose transport system substrate-binding protein
MRKVHISILFIFMTAAILLFTFRGELLTAFSPKKEKDTHRKVIAISTIGATHGWPVGVLYHAKEEVQKIAAENNWDYICLVAGDSNEQSRQVIDLVHKKVDCIIMLPMDGASLKTAAKTVLDAEIPLVIFDREIPDFAPTATVKGDNAGIGVMTAQIFNRYFPKGTKVLEFMGDTSTVPQQRTDGYDDTINDNFTKEQVGYTGWQRSEGRDLFKAWVESHSQKEIDEVGAIFTHDDEIALGILDALDAYEKDNTFKKTFNNLKIISGSAGPQEIYRRILSEDKYYIFSLTYRGSMIREAIRVGEKIMKGENYKEMNILPTFEVNKSNAKEQLNGNSPY